MSRRSLSLLSLVVAIASCAAPTSSSEPVAMGRTEEALWVPGPTMIAGRFLHAFADLGGGKYLVVGGANAFAGASLNALASAESYDASTKKFTAVAPMQLKRVLHTANAMGGKVVVVGGTVGLTSATARVEIYDPSADKWTDAATTAQTHAAHTATLLSSSKLLVIGGFFRPDVERYDLAKDSWETLASMSESRGLHTTTVLDDGRMLVAGGGADPTVASDTAEIYDSTADTWTKVSSKMTTPRAGHTATKLKDGRVLLVGGASGGLLAGTRLRSAEVFDPKSGLFTAVADGPSPRAFHLAQLLPAGRVLVVGGNSDSLLGIGHLRTSDVYDPVANVWRTAGTLARGRTAAVGIPIGQTLMVAGGWDGTPVDVTELLTAAPLGASCTSGTSCESGFCTDSVCCESRCDGSCQVCNASGKCQAAPSGEPSPGHPACGGYTCGDGASPICRTTCSQPSHCAKGFLCKSGQCVPNDAPKCSTDRRSSISTATGVVSSCGSYLCEDTEVDKKGKCRTDCRDTGDCASGFVCGLSNHVCIAAASSTGSSAGCHLSHESTETSGLAFFVGCSVLALGAMRRRRDGRAKTQ